MKRFILTTVAVAFAVVLGCTTNLDAAPHKSAGHVSHASVAAHTHVATHANVAVHPNDAFRAHATLIVRATSVHVPVHVRVYSGWTSRCWLPSYRTYGYYCGTDQLW